MKEVPFIGHVATGEGLRPEPSKVRAIRGMPLLGNDITKPLRDLTRQGAEWIWDELQQSAFEHLKQAVSTMPVLRYYNQKEDVTTQCDTSQRGLSVALLQGGQPVAYASRVD